MVPRKSGPFINSSEVDGSKLFDDRTTVPDHYFVPDRGPFAFLSPTSIDQAVSDASTVLYFNAPDVFLVTSEFSFTIGYKWCSNSSADRPAHPGVFDLSFFGSF